MAAKFKHLSGRPYGVGAESIRRFKFRLRGSSLARRVALRRVTTIAAALLVAGTVHRSVTSAEATTRAWGVTVPVVMTVAEVEAGESLNKASVKIVRVPRGLVPDGALHDIPVDRRARTALERGEMVTRSRVADPSAGSMAARLPPGSQAVTVPLSDSPTPVSVGDVVDVYGVTPDDMDAGTVSASLKIVAESGVVLAVADRAATIAVADSDVAATVSASTDSTLRIVIVG